MAADRGRGDEDRVVVALADWTQRVRPATRGQVRRRSVAAVVVGALFLALVVVGSWALVVGGGPGYGVVGLLLVAVLGALLCWQGARRLRTLGAGPPTDPVALSAPFAFAVQDQQLHFPAFVGHPAESWPLPTTRAEVGRFLGGEALRLSCPGYRARRYPARGLARPPAETVHLLARLTDSRHG